MNTYSTDADKLVKVVNVDVDKDTEQAGHDLLDAGNVVFRKRKT